MNGYHVICNRSYFWDIFGIATQPELWARVNRCGDTAVSNRGTDSGVGLDHVGGTAPQGLMHNPCTAGQICRGVKNTLPLSQKNGPHCPCSCCN